MILAQHEIVCSVDNITIAEIISRGDLSQVPSLTVSNTSFFVLKGSQA